MELILFAAITASTLLSFLQDFGECLWEFVPIHSVKRALVRSDTDVGQEGLAHNQFQFIPKVFSVVEVRALRRPLEFLHTKLIKPGLYGARSRLGKDVSTLLLSCQGTKVSVGMVDVHFWLPIHQLFNILCSWVYFGLSI